MKLLSTAEIININERMFFMYKIDSEIADEFINHDEIMSTIDYMQKNKSNKSLAQNILHKAENFTGLNYKDAAILLECDDAEINQQIFDLAGRVKKNFTAIESLCSHHFIYQIIASTAASIALIISKIKTCRAKNSRKLKLKMKLSHYKIWVINVWHLKPVKTLKIAQSIMFWKASKLFIQ